VKYKPSLTTFSPFGKQNMSEDYTKDEEMLGVSAKDELWSGVEAFVFAEDSNSLSPMTCFEIHLKTH
jgi:hypothetical protein